MSNVWNWIVARLKEPSTWLGLSLAAGAIANGLASKADWSTLIGGVIGAIVNEKGS